MVNHDDETGDTLATESSPLVSSASSEDTETEVWNEMDQAWPASYKRSISLLASPIQSRKTIQAFTKSPKPGRSEIAKIRRANTPDLRLGRKKFLLGLNKAHSLDYTKFAVSQDRLDAANRQQQLKLQQAKEYRASILKKQEQSKTFSKDQSKGSSSRDSGATFSQCVFNLANILMGVGLLGLPFVFKSAGWLGGSLCLLTFAVSAWRTSILIARELNGDPRPLSLFDPKGDPVMRSSPQLDSFPDIARAAFGEVGCIVLAVVLYFELFSCICVLLVAMGDHLHQLYPSVSFDMHTTVAATLSLVPTVFLRTPTLLSYLSMVGTIATMVLVVAVVLSFVFEGDMTKDLSEKEGLDSAGPFRHMFDSSGLAIALGMVSYCFSGHAIVPTIFSSMEHPHQFEKMVTMSFTIVVISCFMVAVSGYMIFGNLVSEEITLSLQENSTAALAMNLLTWLMISTGFSKVTLTMFPLAIGLEEIAAPVLSSDWMVYAVSSILKLCLTVAALLVSLFVPSFSFLVALVGIICTMTVSIVFPAAAHLVLFGPELDLTDKCIDWCFVICGIVLSVVGTLAAL